VKQQREVTDTLGAHDIYSGTPTSFVSASSYQCAIGSVAIFLPKSLAITLLFSELRFSTEFSVFIQEQEVRSFFPISVQPLLAKLKFDMGLQEDLSRFHSFQVCRTHRPLQMYHRIEKDCSAFLFKLSIDCLGINQRAWRSNPLAISQGFCGW
jgi:hypothetical protein